MDEPVRLTVTRPPGVWRDAARAYQIRVDGVLAGQVRRGGTLQVPLPPGRHLLQARIDWSGSRPVEFEAAPGAEVRFSVQAAGNLLNMFWQVFTPDGWLRLTRLDAPS